MGDPEIKAKLLSVLPENEELFGKEFPKQNAIEFTGSDSTRFYDFKPDKILKCIDSNSFTDQFSLSIAIAVCLEFYGKNCRLVLNLEPLSFKELTEAQKKKADKTYERELSI